MTPPSQKSPGHRYPIGWRFTSREGCDREPKGNVVNSSPFNKSQQLSTNPRYDNKMFVLLTVSVRSIDPLDTGIPPPTRRSCLGSASRWFYLSVCGYVYYWFWYWNN